MFRYFRKLFLKTFQLVKLSFVVCQDVITIFPIIINAMNVSGYNKKNIVFKDYLSSFLFCNCVLIDDGIPGLVTVLVVSILTVLTIAPRACGLEVQVVESKSSSSGNRKSNKSISQQGGVDLDKT